MPENRYDESEPPYPWILLGQWKTFAVSKNSRYTRLSRDPSKRKNPPMSGAQPDQPVLPSGPKPSVEVQTVDVEVGDQVYRVDAATFFADARTIDRHIRSSGDRSA